MEIPASHDYVTLPEAVEESTIQLAIFPLGNPEYHPQSYAMLIRRIGFNELVEMKAKLPEEAKIGGIPHYFAIDTVEGKQRLFLWPAPAADLHAKLRYCPAMKEI